MGLRQRKRLLRRRKAAASQARQARRTALITGATFVGVTGLLSSGLTVPVAAAAPDRGPVELVGDANPAGNLEVGWLAQWQDSLLFQGGAPGQDVLWRTDPDGTPVRVFDEPLVDEATIDEVTPFGDKFFFTAAAAGERTEELWISDGTVSGTERLTSAHDTMSDDDTTGDLAVVSGSLIFSRVDESESNYFGGEDIWVSDGTVAGTRKAVDVRDGYYAFHSFAPLGDKVVMAMDYYDDSSALWVTDLTDEGTYELVSGDGYWGVRQTTVVGDTLYFSSDAEGGNELWRTEGTKESTRKVIDLEPDASTGSYPGRLDDLTPLGDGRLVFRTSRPARAWWVSDGTEKGTKQLKSFPKAKGSSWSAAAGADAAGAPLFTVTIGKTTQLWRTDGTSAGTKRLTSFPKGAKGLLHEWSLSEQLPTGQRVFAAHTKSDGRELWSTDGTAKGTKRLTAFGKGDQGPLHNVKGPFADGQFDDLLAAGDRVWFAAHTKSHGAELWSTDGTPKGTGRVSDVNPGKKDSSPARLTSAAGRVWFLANDGTHGQEWWRTTVDSVVRGARVKAAGKQKQPKGNVRVKVKASAKEHVKLRATGSVIFKGKASPVPLKVAKGSPPAVRSGCGSCR